MTLSAITVDKRGTRKTTFQNYEIILGTIKGMANTRGRRSSRATETIVGNLAIKRPIVGKNTRRRNQPNIGRMMPAALMWTFWSQILKGWTVWVQRNN